MFRGLYSGVAVIALSAIGSPFSEVLAQTEEVVNDDNDVVVVTARRRDESIQDVPAAITAFSGAQLEEKGYGNAEDLFSITPGLYFSQQGQRNNDEQFYLTIRGVGTSPVVEPSVGVFVDGVYMPSLGWTIDFLDLERVEVLRGPQGSLFGRNTLAGALNIITKKPNDELRGKGAIEGASFGSVKGSASVSGPLADNVFASFASFVSTTNGYVNNTTLNANQDDRDRFGGRIAIVADLSEALSATVTADYTSSEGHFNALGDASPGVNFRVADPSAANFGAGVEAHALAGAQYTTFGNSEQSIDTENYGGSLTIDYDLGGVIVQSITGYRQVVASDQFDIDGLATGTALNMATTEQEILSEEIRFTSDHGGPFSWIVGGYVFTEELKQERLSTFVNIPGGDNVLVATVRDGFVQDFVTIERDGFAIFGQATYDLTDRLELAAGLRYSHESVDQTPDLNVDVALLHPVLGATTIAANNTVARSASFDGFSPMGSVSYKWTDSLLTYVTVSTGYKGGGFTKNIPNDPSANLSVEEETSLNYEIGLKGAFFGDKLQANLALFRSNIKDMQLAGRVDIGGGVFIPTTTNAGEAHTQGVELDFLARPANGFVLQGAVAYTDSEFDEYQQTAAYDRAGQSLPEVPKWTASVTAEYAFQLPGSDIEIIPSATYRYVGRKFIGEGTSNVPFIDVDSHDVVDAQVAFVTDKLSLTVFARNLFDDYYVVNSFLGQPALAVIGQRAYDKPGAPRQVGVRLSADF